MASNHPRTSVTFSGMFSGSLPPTSKAPASKDMSGRPQLSGSPSKLSNPTTLRSGSAEAIRRMLFPW